MSTQTHDTQAPLGGARNAADAAFGVLAVITLALAAIQIGLAGLGAFGGSFGPHVTLGYVIALLSILMLVAALIARPSRRVVIQAIVLFLLAVPLQPMLATIGENGSSWIGALHALNGVVITGLAGALVGQTRLRRRRPKATT
ncbi:MAG: DUF6220 domain-containing protein [Streptosporangiaceae bacterium]